MLNELVSRWRALHLIDLLGRVICHLAVDELIMGGELTPYSSPGKVYHQNSVRRYRIPRVSINAPIVFHPREILPNPVMPDLSRPSGF